MDNMFSAYHYACKTKKDREAIEALKPQIDEAVKKAVWGNIGDIKYTARTTAPNGGVWCDGGMYDKASFETVYQMLVDGKLQAVTMDVYDSTVSTNGSCGLFGLDTVNQTFKVPTLTDVYIKSGQAAQTFGAESLPNHTHTGTVALQGTFDNYNTGYYNQFAGADYSSGRGTGTLKTGGASVGVYKDNAKVNPDHVKYRAYIILCTVVKDVSIGDYTNVLTNATREGVDTLNAKTLSGMSDLANASNALRTTQVGPCVYEMPQNINYGLVDNRINLIAGSKLYFPYGKTDLSADYPKGSIFLSKFKVVSTYYTGGKFFLCVETMEDILDASQWGTVEKGTFLVDNKGTIRAIGTARYSAGATPPTETDSRIWYDTNDNLIKRYSGGAVISGEYQCFPVIEAMLSGNNDSKVTDIKKVFGGYSIIGQMMLVYPGTKILAPNKRNPDGTLNNIEYTVKGIITRTYNYTTTGQCVALSENIIWGASKYVVSDDRPAISTYTYWYCPQDHVMRYCDSSTDAGWSVVEDRVVIAYNIVTDSSYKITSVDFVKPFTAVDYSDAENFFTKFVPNYNAGVSKSIDTTYTAERNGFLWCRHRVNVDANTAVRVSVNGGAAIDIGYGNNYSGDVCMLPIAKGDTYRFTKSGNTGVAFAFYPSRG